MKTIQEKVTAALLARGFTPTDRADKFQYPALANKYYFLGSSGSVRVGRNKSTSRPILDSIKQDLIKEGESILWKPKKQECL